MMLFVKLFYEFFKVGLFAVGGGMATVPFLYDMSDATGWFTYDELTNMIAVGESTPGPIGVNMATYVGYITGMDAGGVASALLGAVVATLWLVAPSIVVILIIAVFLKNFRNNPYVNGAFYGLRPASTGLIAAMSIMLSQAKATGLIAAAGLGVAVSNFFLGDIFVQGLSIAAINWKGLILAVILWFFTNRVKKIKSLHPIIFIAASAIIGIIFSME